MFVLFFYNINLGININQHNDLSLQDKKKAVFIYNFTKHITLPRHMRADSIFSIGVLGINNMNLFDELDEMSKFKMIGHKRIKTLFFESVNDLKFCNIIYFNADEFNSDKIYSKFVGKGTLIVSENLRSYEKAMVTFISQNNILRFTINDNNIIKQNLQISEELKSMGIRRSEEWSSVFEKFRKVSSENSISINQTDVNEVMNVFNEKNKEIEFRNNEIDRKNIALVNQEKVLKDKQDEIRAQKNKLNSAMASLLSKEEQIALQENKLSVLIEENNLQENSLLIKQKEFELEKEKTEIQKEQIEQQTQKLNETNKKVIAQLDKINNQNTILTLFAALVIFCVIAVLYVIRNQRKLKSQNKVIEEQKQEVEQAFEKLNEKNKEIIDSITYAARIQKSLITTEVYIGKFLNRRK